MFKEYYELRDFKPGQFGDEKPAQQFLNELREAIKPAPGQRLLPWYRKRSGNPLNAKNKVCKNKG
jgi:putative component of toxin-antitoxin plasmid stabilization module